MELLLEVLRSAPLCDIVLAYCWPAFKAWRHLAQVHEGFAIYATTSDALVVTASHGVSQVQLDGQTHHIPTPQSTFITGSYAQDDHLSIETRTFYATTRLLLDLREFKEFTPLLKIPRSRIWPVFGSRTCTLVLYQDDAPMSSLIDGHTRVHLPRGVQITDCTTPTAHKSVDGFMLTTGTSLWRYGDQKWHALRCFQAKVRESFMFPTAFLCHLDNGELHIWPDDVVYTDVAYVAFCDDHFLTVRPGGAVWLHRVGQPHNGELIAQLDPKAEAYAHTNSYLIARRADELQLFHVESGRLLRAPRPPNVHRFRELRDTRLVCLTTDGNVLILD
jgi:hypothetical protein